ncbi:hypothetical protein KIN20_012795 [Parelaphostrongylus tenuis]|uniref:Uncharacterized protein n=1 Tax=Parelaphostrongylus tenuis TaxID=148309 RepID=A0AAD5MTU0_PARTN|nr:hypothetical protein KIN20_012795 [Parelaphostrongylus tenuis]
MLNYRNYQFYLQRALGASPSPASELPVSMVAYTGDGNIPTEVPGIARSKETAKGFVERLVMQTASSNRLNFSNSSEFERA